VNAFNSSHLHITNNYVPKPLSWKKKSLFAAATTLFALIAAETLLTIFGIRPVTDTRDPFVGFAQQIPLMELARGADGQEYYRTSANKLVWFNAQSFPKQKSSKTRRIFCMGGSTTYGHPYDDTTSFSGWMREYLPLIDDSHEWQVINCGGISYASYRVAALMEELANYQPDIFVVYSVHNEFLERRTYADMFERSRAQMGLQAALSRTKTYAAVEQLIDGFRGRSQASPSEQLYAMDILPGEVDEILNHTIGPIDYHRDPLWRQKVVAHYESNLRRMIDIAQLAGATIVFVSPASNERNCSPFKSEFEASVTTADQDYINKAVAHAEVLLQSRNNNIHNNEAAATTYKAAQQELESAIRKDPGFAIAHYRLGQILWEQKRLDEAQNAFQLALNTDVCPLRAVEEITVAIHRTCEERHVPMVDFESKLRQWSRERLGHACLGDELFLDHVHPTIEVNDQLAQWILASLLESKIISGKSLNSIDPKAKQEASARIGSRIDQKSHGVSLRNLAKVLHWAGKFDEAAPRASDAIELLPNDPESRFVLADCLKNIGDIDGALRQYELLFSGENDWPRGYLPYGELLYQQGQFLKAKTFLMLAVLREPSNPYAHFMLGKTHIELNETQFAIDSLSEASRLYPNEPGTLKLMEQLKR
jgi:tetratricopeptide (TPR) repeat protein